MSEEEIQRRLELVGVRERRKVDVSGEGKEEMRDVGWREAIFGRRAVRSEKEEEEVEDWARSGEFRHSFALSCLGSRCETWEVS
jgi:hypothetical protein